jgi:hypothetical protein
MTADEKCAVATAAVEASRAGNTAESQRLWDEIEAAYQNEGKERALAVILTLMLVGQAEIGFA